MKLRSCKISVCICIVLVGLLSLTAGIVLNLFSILHKVNASNIFSAFLIAVGVIIFAFGAAVLSGSISSSNTRG
jgi:hypothetical protein